MGTFDISRINFDKTKHYSSVRMQQGRVLTDDDWNENARIENEIQRVSNTEIVGPFGSPDDGFKIANPRLDAGLINFDILPGTLYLGGLRLELEKLETYRLQKDWLQQPANASGTPNFNEKERYDLVYLESWQQPVSAIEDSSLFEVALGGPDTTTRLRNMRRVHLATAIGFSNCKDAWNKLKSDWQAGHLGIINKEYERIADTLLKVSFSNAGLPEDLCAPSAAGGYLGAENQAIRVQLVDQNHFTWGFDNASPLYRVAVSANGKKVQMLTEPKDQYHWPLSNQVIEILPWSAVLSNGEKVAEQIGHLTKVESSYDPDTGEFTLQDAVSPTFGIDWKSRTDKNELDNQIPPEYFYLRVWNRGDDLSSDGKISFTAGMPVVLGHTGLQITITGNDRVSGDYWVIAARPETPNMVIPWEFEKGIRPHGVRRFFAPLAVLKWTHEISAIERSPRTNEDREFRMVRLKNLFDRRGPQKKLTNDVNTDEFVSGEVYHDCRIPFDPLTKKQGACIVVNPGPGWERIFERFQDEDDICVCFKNAIYELDAAVILNSKGNIKFTGCGKGSQIIVYNDEAAFAFINCKDILIRDLSIKTDISVNGNNQKALKHLNGVLTISGCENILLENLSVACQSPKGILERQMTCVTVNAQNEKLRETTVVIQNCRFLVGFKQTGLLIINTIKTIIEGNVLNSLGKVGNQGIVIAGTRPKNVTIKDNLINGMLQGIHVGTSNNKMLGKAVIMASNVIISGNSIECILRFKENKERHGIFVGNCDSLVIKDNFIKLNKQADESERWPSTNGIRVFGYLGKRIIIRDNHLEGFGYTTNIRRGKKRFIDNIGILVHYLNTPAIPRWWIVEANVTEQLRIEGVDRLFRTSKMIYADRWREI